MRLPVSNVAKGMPRNRMPRASTGIETSSGCSRLSRVFPVEPQCGEVDARDECQDEYFRMEEWVHGLVSLISASCAAVSVSGTLAAGRGGETVRVLAARLRLLLSSHSCVQATVTMTATVLTAQAVNTACQDCERMSIALTMPTPAGRKKESHVVGQEPGDRSDCFRFDDFAAECCEQQYHADDAARYETARQRTDKFAGGVKQQNDENSR